MNFSTFDIEFFELANSLKTTLNVETLKKSLLKLNNPTYYSKFTSTHPASSYGYYQKKTINPLLKAISAMLQILKSTDSDELKLRQLQQEYAWAFHHYSWYQNLEKQNA
jgi:hypothetical protein